MRIFELLNELKILKVYSNEQRGTIPVIVNPSKKDFNAFMDGSKDGHEDAYLYKNKLYVWDAWYTYHMDLANELGIDDDKAINLHFFIKGSPAWRTGESDDTDQYLINHYPVIQRIA